MLTAGGCGNTHSRYNNEYLYSAQHLEQGLKENPDSANKEVIKKRIKKLYKLHAQMLEQERDMQNGE